MSSYGFRPGRNAHQAVKAAKQYVAEGRRVVVDMYLEKFFDRVNHDLLMAKLAKKVGDGRVLKLIRRYLEAGMMAEGAISPRTQGTSPLLSNILLTSGTGARRACVLSPRGRLQHLRPQPGGR